MRAVALLTVIAVVAIPALASKLVFEPAEDGLAAVARGAGGSVVVSHSGAVFTTASGPSVRMRIVGSAASVPEFLEPLVGSSHYFIGNDAAKWRRGVPHHARVRYSQVRPGIDVVYYGDEKRVEYDFVVAPGADPNEIELAFDGADAVEVESGGDLVVVTGEETIRHLRPRVYQQIAGKRLNVAGRYHVARSGRVRFALGRYDRKHELVIDPIVQFAAYIGKGGHDTASAVAIDAGGNVWIAGTTNSINFATSGAWQPHRAAPTDAWLAKMSPSGALLAVTYFGGSKFDQALAVAVDAAGNPYLSGVTLSEDLPTRSAAQSDPGGGTDVFVAKFNQTASTLVYSTFVGGSSEDWCGDIDVDSQGAVWLTGWTRSSNFPVQGALQGGTAGGGGDAFITRIAPSGAAFMYSTYFGAEGVDQGSGIAIDVDGNVHITGSTTSASLPLERAAQARPGGGMDAFFVKLDPRRNQILFSTYLGGSGDEVGIRAATDQAGNGYALGYTRSTNFPATTGAAQTTSGGMTDIFVARFDGISGTLTYATYLGGSGDDWAGGIAVDSAGSAYISGWSNSLNYPVRNAAQQANAGGIRNGFDAVATRLSPDGNTLLYSTYYGGRGEDRAYAIALDASGQVWLAGATSSNNLPSATGEFNTSLLGDEDAFVVRLSADAASSFLSATPSTVAVTARSGEAELAPVTVQVLSTGGAVQFTAATSVPWLRVSPESSSAPGRLTITANVSTLPFGQNRGEVLLRSPSSSLTIPVIISVTAAPLVSAVSPATLPAGAPETVVTITGSGFTRDTVAEIGGARVPTTFIDARTMQITVAAGLLRSEGTLTLVLIGPDVRSTPFSLRVAAQAPSISAAGIVSAATWQAGPVAPGQFVVIGGSGFGAAALAEGAPAQDGRLRTSLAGVRVLFDGLPAPLLWVGSGRVAAQAPYSLSQRSTTRIVVESLGAPSAPVEVTVQPAAPGLFTANGTGTGQASALNQDGTLNSPANPAARGSVIVLYATGEGLTSPSVQDGSVVPAGVLPRPALPVSVTIGGVPAIVEYAGGVPGMLTGLVQINARAPASVEPGSTVPVVISAGPFSSPASGVTVAIR